MRVLLDASYARRGPSGTAVYVQQLAAALRDQGVEVLEAVDEERHAPGAGGPSSVRNAAHDLRWRQRLGRLARGAGADVIHHPLPAHTWAAPCPQVVTVHDLAFLQAPELFAAGYRRHAALEHRAAARRADAVVCVSNATFEEVRARWDVAPERLVVARHGPGQFAGAGVDAGEGSGAAPRHFLYVGDDEPRKNLALLLEGYSRYRLESGAGDAALDLVLAGSLDIGSRPGVRVERAASAERLRERHAQAALLVHTARLEGFGLTVLEAMSLGTPVLALRSAAVQELGADAVHYLEEEDPGALAQALANLASDPGTRAELSRRGLARAAAFSWADSARAHIEAYTLAVSR